MIIQERIHRKRLDFLHKLSKGYANKYDIITEELNTMLENKPSDTNKHNNTLHRNIQESAFKFIDMLKYKAKLLIQVDPENTSQECYNCDIAKKELKDRVHECPSCNIKIDRDYNSALNILKRGLERLQLSERYTPLNLNIHLPMGHGEVTPRETLKLVRIYETGSLTFQGVVAHKSME